MYARQLAVRQHLDGSDELEVARAKVIAPAQLRPEEAAARPGSQREYSDFWFARK
jgi:hypothetical protein